MKPAVSAALFVAMGIVLTGCSSTMRNYLEKETPGETVSMRQDLTMPPDLRLPPPGTTAPAPDPGAVSASRSTAALTVPPAEGAPVQGAKAAPAVSTGAAATSAADSIYTSAGISLYKPDGTRKTDAELRAELQAYYIAQKKAKNPNYGTVYNIGNIFKDE